MAAQTRDSLQKPRAGTATGQLLSDLSFDIFCTLRLEPRPPSRGQQRPRKSPRSIFPGLKCGSAGGAAGSQAKGVTLHSRPPLRGAQGPVPGEDMGPLFKKQEKRSPFSCHVPRPAVWVEFADSCQLPRAQGRWPVTGCAEAPPGPPATAPRPPGEAAAGQGRGESRQLRTQRGGASSTAWDSS